MFSYYYDKKLFYEVNNNKEHNILKIKIFKIKVKIVEVLEFSLRW